MVPTYSYVDIALRRMIVLYDVMLEILSVALFLVPVLQVAASVIFAIFHSDVLTSPYVSRVHAMYELVKFVALALQTLRCALIVKTADSICSSPSTLY